jgi:hypothetical protein
VLLLLLTLLLLVLGFSTPTTTTTSLLDFYNSMAKVTSNKKNKRLAISGLPPQYPVLTESAPYLKSYYVRTLTPDEVEEMEQVEEKPRLSIFKKIANVFRG